MSVAVIGAGAFGTALAVSLASKGKVALWGRDIGWARSRENPRLPGVRLPAGLQVTSQLEKIEAETLLLALPAQVLGGFLTEHALRLDGRQLAEGAERFLEMIGDAVGGPFAISHGAPPCRKGAGHRASRPAGGPVHARAR